MYTHPFITGVSPPPPEPLSRFLPPIPVGIVEEWLHQILKSPGDKTWILDPFCASPRLVIEAARAGWRVLVAANNPVLRFLLGMYANLPSENEFQSGLAELAASMRGNERLEPHIRSLYTVSCLECNSPVEVDAFLWERDADAPYAYLAVCPSCNSTGEKALLPQDADRARIYATVGLHRARAIERVIHSSDPDRVYVEEALSVYLPRAVYGLFTLLNKLDGLNISIQNRRALQALILNACDVANTLWAYPTERSRPRQLVTPPRFRENNIWKSLEDGIHLWGSNASLVQITTWPELPGLNGGICVFEGPLRDLATRLSEKIDSRQIAVVFAAIPRPNQAFWTLSALWSGWLWGKEEAAQFRSVLRRRRYDWAWHYTALRSAFERLTHIIYPDTPIFFLTGEAETGLLSAAILAAGRAGFSVLDVSLKGEQAQLHLRSTQKPITPAKDLNRIAVQSMKDFLSTYGQPAPFLNTWLAGLIGLENSGALRTEDRDSSEDSSIHLFNDAQNTLRNCLTYRAGFLRYGSGDNIETSFFWTREEPSNPEAYPDLPYGDRLEVAVHQILTQRSSITFKELEAEIHHLFRGLLTPEKIWIQMILESYALKTSPEGDTWQIRPEDQPQNRQQDLEKTRQQLAQLAYLFGYTQMAEFPLVWTDQSNTPRYWFYPLISATFSNLILGKTKLPRSPADQSIIVLPGGRANLTLFKLRRDPRLAALCHTIDSGLNTNQIEKRGWRFLKTRHLRWLLDNAIPLQQSLDKLLELDPLTFSAPQMRLL